jgi:hypothetical protein
LDGVALDVEIAVFLQPDDPRAGGADGITEVG